MTIRSVLPILPLLAHAGPLQCPANGATTGCNSRFRLGTVEPRPWIEAEGMALNATKQMSNAELVSLVYGSAWPPHTFTGPIHGYYTGHTPAIPRLGIPPLKMQDAAQGYRPLMDFEVGTVTCWPSLLHLAATWDEELVMAVAAAIAREYVIKGANVLLGPSVNVHRVARGGRNFEYMSGDDPYLGARLTKAYTLGAQGEGVVAVAKHWAFNEQETSRMFQNSIVDARTAWELYYPPFEAAVEAGIGGFMCSYNKVNGTYACENEGILKRDLKEGMGFKGFVQSDWGATHSTGAMARGLDQDMPGNDFFFTLPNLEDAEQMYQFQAFMKGEKKELTELQKAAGRVLAAVYRLRLEERPGCDPDATELGACWNQRYTVARSEEHSALNREATAMGVVLLQNEGALPLDKAVKTVAVIGCAAHSRPTQMGNDQQAGAFANMGADFYTGGGSGKVFVREDQVPTPYEAIRERGRQAKVNVVLGPSSPNGTYDEMQRLGGAVDVFVVVTGTTAAEMADRKHLHVEYWNDDLVTMATALKPTVVLMQAPGAMYTPWRSEVAAVAVNFLAGEETGAAWAGLVFGDYNPAGKLPIMFPAAKNDFLEPWAMEVPYSEGLFTSYRSRQFIPSFPFGHGISFTEFDYGTASVVACTGGEAACVELEITNSGKVAGQEVVQAYLDLSAVPNTPKQQLKGFHKTTLLQPGKSEKVTFAFRERDLSYFSVEAMDWRRVPGVIPVRIGSSCEDIRERLELPAA